MLDVSCIIINYNTAKYTIACIESIIEKNKTANFEIIVVDNASETNDVLELKKGLKAITQKPIKYIESKINLGFGAGNMLGYQLASASKYVAFINNDCTILSNNLLQELCNFMDKTPDAGVCGPQMLNEHKEAMPSFDYFASIQREILKRKTLHTLFPKTYINRKKSYKSPQKVQFVNGSFMFFNRKDFNAIGGFDTNLFLYYEETDTCLRLLKKLNKFAYYIPHLQYIHFMGKSTKKSLPIKIEQKLALIYTIRKHYGFFHQKLLLTYYIIRYGLTSIVKPKYFKLFMVFLKGAPMALSLKQKQKLIVLTQQ